MSAKVGRRADRLAVMLAVASSHQGEPMTIAEFAAMCGREAGQTFTRDLAAARHYALDADNKLSHCVVMPDGLNRLVFKADEGDDLTTRALVRYSHTARTYNRNAGRAGDWEARHGDTASHRTYGAIISEISKGVDSMHQAVEILEREMLNGSQ